MPVREKITIMGVAPAPCAPRSGVVTITGRGFGATQAYRAVSLNGLPPIVLMVKSWSDEDITVLLPSSVTPGKSYRVGLQDSQGNWITSVVQRVTVCR